MLVVVAVVLAANGPYLLGITKPNALGPGSGLAITEPGLVRGADTLDPTAGYITQALGHVAASDLLHGHLPLWNPYEGAGMPLLAEGQSAALFPPTLLLAVDNGQFWEDLLLEIVAALATFGVLRRIGVRRAAAVAGAAAFGLNGAFAWLATTSFDPIAFLPLLVLGIEHAHEASRTGRRGGWWLIAVALALSLYAGFPETAYIDGLLVAVWFLWRCGSGDRTHLRRMVVKVGAGVGAGVLLAAPFLVAFAGALPHEYTGIHTTNIGAVAMPRFAFPQLLLPYVYGMPLAYSDRAGLLSEVWGYAGGFASMSLLFLAALSLLASSRRGLKLLLVAWLALALAKVYGQPPILRSILLILPGAKSVTFYRYSFPAIDFALSVLAALGIDDFSARLARRRAALGVTAGAVVITAVVAYEAHRLVLRLDGGAPWEVAQVAWTVVILASLTICLLWRGRSPGIAARARAASAILIADLALMFMLHELAAPRAVRVDRAPVAYLQHHLEQGRFFTLGPLAPNYGGYWNLASLNDIDLPLPSRWVGYVNGRLDKYVNPIFFVGNNGGGRSLALPSPEHELMAHLASYQDSGVSYVVTPPGTRLPQSRSTFKLVLRTPVAWLYHLAHAAPYFAGSPRCAIRPEGRQRANVDCAGSGTLTRRELAFPGWTARVDGRRTPIHVTSDIFQSVPIPSGIHTVSFSYETPGLGLSLVGLLAGAVWLILGTAWSRRICAAPRRAAYARPGDQVRT